MAASSYDERGINTLIEGYNSVQADFREADEYYFNELQALKLNLSVANKGQADLKNLTVVITLPRVPEFAVIERLCQPPGLQRTEHEADLLGYPTVKHYKGTVQIRQDIELLPAGAQVPLFENALRLAVQPKLAGRKVAIRCALQAEGLASPEEGLLKLVVRK